MPDLIVVTDTTTKAQLSEAMANIRATQRRANKAQAERLSATLDMLLDAYRAAKN